MEKIAFLSVYHKDGIDTFAKELVNLGWKIMSSSGTAKYLRENGIECADLADIVGAPILGHRVVSLSREFYAMLLARRDNKEDMAELAKLKLPVISLVCCDMYPLEEEIRKQNHLEASLPLGSEASKSAVIEKTDIGGPTMLRAGAKGGRIVVCGIEDRGRVIEWLKNKMPDEKNFKRELAGRAEYVVAKYALASAEYLSNGKYKGIIGQMNDVCTYGENAYQTPSYLYQSADGLFSPDKFKLLTETPLSYNNFCDRDKVLGTITHFSAGFKKNFDKAVSFFAIAVKHGNACGVGISSDPIEALKKMIEGDVRAIHGGSVFTNFKIGEDEAELLIHYQMKEGGRRLLDTITAPDFGPNAIEILARKKGKCRIVINRELENLSGESLDESLRIRNVRDGFLVQPNYTFVPDFKEASIESDSPADLNEKIKLDLVLAWAIGSNANSNTITIVKDGKLIGNGVGQQDRVGAAKLAIMRADDASFALSGQERAKLEGAVAYSDSFFPFSDGPEVLIDRGIKTIFATSGSVNDKEVIEFCKNRGVTLVMYPDKTARGFAWH